jgi:spore coat protein H
MNIKKTILINSFLLFILTFIYSGCDTDENREIVAPSQKIELFNLKDLPEIQLTVPLKDWNTLLTNYDLNPKNDKKVVARFDFVLNGKLIKLDSIGLRLRGNTSRRRPEGTNGQVHNELSPDWHHCHFGLDFSKFKEKQQFSGLDKMNLKWFKDDATYSREIYCYDLFRRYGIWTAPKASYCKVTILVQGDSKPAYFGVYEMIESIDEVFISNRKDKWGSSLGFLWKGGWSGSYNADFVQTASIGVEDVKLDPSKSKYFAYDLKIREAELATAKSELIQFIQDLNTKTDADFKFWIMTKMDVPLFLKTYAVNVMVGMWDDYWVNGNNFYFYFAGNNKAYFIPYDYDNTLGTSAIIANSGTQNPLQWGQINVRPLVNKILAIPEYKLLYKSYLKELIQPNLDLFDATKSMQRIGVWRNLVQAHINNDTNEDMYLVDSPAQWGNAPFYRLFSGNDQGGANGDANFFKTKAATIVW